MHIVKLLPLKIICIPILFYRHFLFKIGAHDVFEMGTGRGSVPSIFSRTAHRTLVRFASPGKEILFHSC